MVDKSDEETVEEETQVEQTSAASLAWVLDTCAEAVVELTDAEDFADACVAAGPAHQSTRHRSIRDERRGQPKPRPPAAF